jgi:hypothetical protein
MTEEHATRTRRPDSFPSQWGQPPADEEQRAAWIVENIVRETVATNDRRRVEIAQRRYGPGEP